MAAEGVEIARVQARVSTLEAIYLFDGDNKSLQNNFQPVMRAQDQAREEVATAKDEADEAGRRAVRTARSARYLVSGLDIRPIKFTCATRSTRSSSNW